MNAYDLYVVICHSGWTGSSMDDEVYATREEAETACAAMQPLPSSTLTYSVHTLADAISELRTDARLEGEQTERESQHRGY